MKDLILAIDNGTQSVRALLFDPTGKLEAKNRVPIEPYFSSQPGWAEQHPQVFWEAVCQACQGLWVINPGYRQRLAAVAVTAQRSTVINLDQQGNPLRPAILWLDGRRSEGVKPVRGWWGLAFRLGNVSETIAYLQAEAEANWIAANQPEIWARTHKYVFVSGYLTYRLVHRFVDSISCQVGYVPFDYKHHHWSKPWDWKWQAVPVEPSMLVELVSPSEILGEITTEASQATGIPAGLPLVAAAADKACEVIGAGCLEPQIACLSYATAATINTTHTRYVEIIPMIPPYPAAVPGRYSLELQVYRGYWMVSWFKQEFGQLEVEQAYQGGGEPEILFDKLVNAVPPGSDGLVVQPFWSPGLRTPGPEARGAIIGFNAVHTRAHLYRAILEGLAYALREGADRTSQRSGVPIRELRVAGGGSQSQAAMQLTADIFGLPATRPQLYEASGLGAAINAAVGVGLHPSFNAAVADMTHPGQTYEPDPGRSKLYDELYQEVYKKMYDRLQPLYHSIRRII